MSNKLDKYEPDAKEPVEFTTNRYHVTVGFHSAKIVDNEKGIEITRKYTIEEYGGKKCLYLGTIETDDGIEQIIVPIESHKEEIELMRMLPVEENE